MPQRLGQAGRFESVELPVRHGADVKAVENSVQTHSTDAPARWRRNGRSEEHGLGEILLPEAKPSPAAIPLTLAWPPWDEYEDIFHAIVANPRYESNLGSRIVAAGHPRVTVRAHLRSLERNLTAFSKKVSPRAYWKLKILVHTHDTFWDRALPGVSITHPRNHASLAREHVASVRPNSRLLTMVQYHDEPYALWKRAVVRGQSVADRLEALLYNIQDWDLFLTFIIIDGCTNWRSREPMQWLFAQVERKVKTKITVADIL